MSVFTQCNTSNPCFLTGFIRCPRVCGAADYLPSEEAGQLKATQVASVEYDAVIYPESASEDEMLASLTLTCILFLEALHSTRVREYLIIPMHLIMIAYNRIQ